MYLPLFIFASTGAVWLLALRPHLVRRGQGGGGAGFDAAFWRDLTIAGELARKGDRHAQRLRQIVIAGLFLFAASFLIFI